MDKQSKSAEERIEELAELLKNTGGNLNTVIQYYQKTIATLQQANAELEKEAEYYKKIISAGQSIDWTMISNTEKLEKQNAELTEIARAYYEHLKRQDAETGLNVYSDRMKQRIFEAVQSHESNSKG